MEYDYVTAEWAKKKSKELLDIVVSEELENILSKIEDAVEAHKDSLYSTRKVEFDTLGELEKRGFEIEENGIDGQYEMKVTWKN